MESENKHPFFCIVIPTFNRAHMLSETLDHIRKQVFSDFQIIVVDDGSTDETASLVRNMMQQENKLQYVYQENKERGAARNLGFKLATCDYVVFFDSDDVMHPDHLSTLHDEILKKQYPDFIATQFDFIDIHGNHQESDCMLLPEGYYDYRLFLNGNPLGTNVCVRRSMKDLKLFREEPELSIKEDWIFFLQNLHNNRLYLVAKVTISMVDHPGRSMHLAHQKRIEQSFRAAAWLRSNMELHENEVNELMAHVNYLSSIHAYLDLKKRKALSYLGNAILLKGIRKKYAILLIKILLGYRLIKMLHASDS